MWEFFIKIFKNITNKIIMETTFDIIIYKLALNIINITNYLGK